MASSTPNAGTQNSVGSSNPSVAATSKKKNLPRNAAGSKVDEAWKYGTPVNGDNRRIQCKFCSKVLLGSINRLKHHLAGTSKDVAGCKGDVPNDVKQAMLVNVAKLQKNLIEKSIREVEEDVEDEVSGGGQAGTKRMSNEIAKTNSTRLFKRRCSVQTSISSIFKKGLKEDEHIAIANFFVNNAIPYNASRGEDYKLMFEAVIRHGQGFIPPTCYELRVKYLPQQVKLTNDKLVEYRAEWKKVGCTLMTDGWTDRRRRTIMNFLVNSPKGTVFLKSIDASHISKTGEVIFKMLDEFVDEIGEENVVQVVTDNAANCVLAGQMLMEKRPHLYWTPCAAHTVDLMLEDLMKIDYHARTIPKGKKITKFIYQRTSLIHILNQHTSETELVRPGATRFATSYLTLGCLYKHKDSLMRMFLSKEWKANRNSKTTMGIIVEEIVLDSKGFWEDVKTCLRGALPLVKVLRLVDSDQKPAMGFVYEAMDKSKKEIQANFNNSKKRYICYLI